MFLTDPVTKEWLASNTDPVFGFPSIVRFSWSTAVNILSSDTLAVKWLACHYQVIVLFCVNVIGRMMMEIPRVALK